MGKANIFVNTPEETTYFYQDLDENGERLDGPNCYTVTFAADKLPPVKGFWSLTLYNEHHFFHPERARTATRSAPRTSPCKSTRRLADPLPPQHTAADDRGEQLAARARRAVLAVPPRLLARQPILDGDWTPPRRRAVLVGRARAPDQAPIRHDLARGVGGGRVVGVCTPRPGPTRKAPQTVTTQPATSLLTWRVRSVLSRRLRVS